MGINSNKSLKMGIKTCQIFIPSISVTLSMKLKSYISKLEVSVTSEISYKVHEIKVQHKPEEKAVYYPVSEEETKLIRDSDDETDFFSHLSTKSSQVVSNANLLSLRDLQSIYYHILERNKKYDEKVYLHELLQGSNIILPENQHILRNEELENRCQILRAKQENKRYHEMTRNIDNVKKCYAEDSIGFHLKQMNRSLLTIFQVILSIGAGFTFGFIGQELIIGSLEFQFKFILGIMCASTVAFAELYFFVRKLNEDF